MKPVPYEIYKDTRWLLWRTIAALCIAIAATAILNFLTPENDISHGDTPTAAKIFEGLTDFLLWVLVIMSTLTLVGIAALEGYARIAGVEQPRTAPNPNPDAQD